MKLYEYTVHELIEKLEKGETTSEEITKSYFKRIKGFIKFRLDQRVIS